MQHQAYYRVSDKSTGDIARTDVPLQLNCCGVVSGKRFHTSNSRNDFYLMYMLNGKLSLQLSTFDYQTTLNSGDFILISPKTAYEYFTPDLLHTEYLWLHFTGSDAQALPERLNLPLNKRLHIGANQTIIALFRHCFLEFVKYDEYFDEITELYLRNLMAQFSRASKTPDAFVSLEKSIFYIHTQYNKPLSIPELAAMEGMSETKYRTKFKLVTGTTPIEYITARRLEAAVHLLECTSLALPAIAEATGFNDSYYFGRVFKAKFGMSPGKYRKR